MIQAKIREQGNSYVVTIPRERNGEIPPPQGDRISFTPIRSEQRYGCGSDVQQALNKVVEKIWSPGYWRR